jgi:integrase
MLNDPQNYSYETIRDLISQLKESDKNLACLAYGSGARVSELNKLRKKDIQPLNEYLRITCPVLKKKDNKEHVRIAVIRLDETWLIDPILSMLKDKAPDDILIPLHRVTIYKKLIAAIGINPHGFRKLRATHLVVKFKLNGQQLKKFFDWSRSDMADQYVKLNTEDIQY